MQNSTVFIRFCLVGGIGFVSDLAILYLLMAVSLPPLIARLFSAVFAMLVTWRLNRTFTFRYQQPSTVSEAMRYLGINGLGFGINYLTFTLCILVFGLSPFSSLAVASCVGLAFNFTGNQRWVFTSKR